MNAAEPRLLSGIPQQSPPLPAELIDLAGNLLKKGEAFALISLPAPRWETPGWVLCHGLESSTALDHHSSGNAEPGAVWLLSYEWCTRHYIQYLKSQDTGPDKTAPGWLLYFSKQQFFAGFAPLSESIQAGSWVGPDKNAYLKDIAKIKAWLAQGKMYQLNLTRAWTRNENLSAVWLRWLAGVSQFRPPLASFIFHPGGAVASLTMEELFSLRGRQVVTGPIKGTAANDQDTLADQKNRSEHLMIVDLERNDMGTLCVPGSIHVDPFAEAVDFGGIRHLVSLVHGTLPTEQKWSALLQRLVPGGSVTGAPKKAVLEHIPEVEPEPRGIYCGAIGYCHNQDTIQFSLPIRTLEWTSDGVSRSCSGGGIIYDSDPEAEWQEMNQKRYWLGKP